MIERDRERGGWRGGGEGDGEGGERVGIQLCVVSVSFCTIIRCQRTIGFELIRRFLTNRY